MLKVARMLSKKFWDLVELTVRVTDTYILEIQNSSCSMIIGVLMAFGGHSLYLRSPTAWSMFEIAPYWVWGLLYFSAGALHLLFLKLRWELVRKYILLVKAALWVFLGTNLLFGIDWFVPAAYVYYVFAAVAFRGYFKIEVEVRVH